MDAVTQFLDERKGLIQTMDSDAALKSNTSDWLIASVHNRYVYNFDWLGRPIIQYPQDMVAMQELIWSTRPDIIVETGIAHGGSLILSASMLALLDYCDAMESGEMLDPRKPKRRVIGVDIDIRAHNRAAIEAHPLANRIDMIQGSSIDPAIVEQVRRKTDGAARVLVSLDSNHTHDHVLGELEAYAPMVTPGSYCVVFDTFVETLPPGIFADRPWDVGNSPLSAVKMFLQENPNFVSDDDIPTKLQVTAAPSGFLRRKS